MTMANVNVVRSTYGTATHDRIIIDTGNLSGKHLISNPSFFTALDLNAQLLPVAGATDDVALTQGEGSCDLITFDKDGAPTRRVRLDDCAYWPYGINLISVQLAKQQGITVSLDDMQLVFPDGSVIPFDDDYSIGVTPMPREADPQTRP